MTGFSISWMKHVLPKYTDDRNITKTPPKARKNTYKNHEHKKNEEKLTVLPRHIDKRNNDKS